MLGSSSLMLWDTETSDESIRFLQDNDADLDLTTDPLWAGSSVIAVNKARGFCVVPMRLRCSTRAVFDNTGR